MNVVWTLKRRRVLTGLEQPIRFDLRHNFFQDKLYPRRFFKDGRRFLTMGDESPDWRTHIV